MVVNLTPLYIWIKCHAALDAASSLCFFWVPAFAGMTTIVKGFMKHYNRVPGFKNFCLLLSAY